ncbi:hypothetical protein GW916_06770 [bacterium]|nr:hypothetical protein [bacterium]
MSIAISSLMGCETMRGVDSRQELSATITDKSCIVRAIKSVKDVQYLASNTKDEEIKSWKNEPIHRKLHYFIYEIPQLSKLKKSDQLNKKPISQIILTEETSENPKLTSASYYNSFGHMNGENYNDSEKETAKRLIRKIDMAVVNYCELKTNISEPRDR